jgi:hypothetical protein
MNHLQLGVLYEKTARRADDLAARNHDGAGDRPPLVARNRHRPSARHRAASTESAFVDVVFEQHGQRGATRCITRAGVVLSCYLVRDNAARQRERAERRGYGSATKPPKRRGADNRGANHDERSLKTGEQPREVRPERIRDERHRGTVVARPPDRIIKSF